MKKKKKKRKKNNNNNWLIWKPCNAFPDRDNHNGPNNNIIATARIEISIAVKRHPGDVFSIVTVIYIPFYYYNNKNSTDIQI